MEPRIKAFMDESFDPSQSGDAVVCAAALFDEKQIKLAEAALAEAKIFAGVPADTELHCKIVFSGQRRKHSAWRDVTVAQIFVMLERLCRRLQEVSLRTLIIILPKQIPVVPAGVDGTPSVALDVKGAVSMGFQMIMGWLSMNYGPDQVQYIIDVDTERIPWGSGNRQAHLTRTTSIDLGAQRQPAWVGPQAKGSAPERLLEVADLYAFVTRRALFGSSETNKQFLELYEIINPAHLETHLNPDPRWQKGRTSNSSQSSEGS